MVGLVVMVVVLVPAAARADSTTTCTIGTWATYCSSYSSSGGGGGGSQQGIWFLGELGGVVIPSIVAGYYMAKNDNDPDGKIGLDIASGWSMLPGPVGFYFGDFVGEPLDADQKDQWRHKPQFVAAAGGGVARDPGGVILPIGTLRAQFGRGRIGLDASAESAQDNKRYSAFAGHLLLRAPPRERSSFALALGVRRLAFGNASMGETQRLGFDVGVPHYFVLSRDDKTNAPDIVIDVKPGFTFASAGVDVHFGASLIVPVADHLALDLGGTMFSFGQATSFVASGAVSTAL